MLQIFIFRYYALTLLLCHHQPLYYDVTNFSKLPPLLCHVTGDTTGSCGLSCETASSINGVITIKAIHVHKDEKPRSNLIVQFFGGKAVLAAHRTWPSHPTHDFFLFFLSHANKGRQGEGDRETNIIIIKESKHNTILLT